MISIKMTSYFAIPRISKQNHMFLQTCSSFNCPKLLTKKFVMNRNFQPFFPIVKVVLLRVSFAEIVLINCLNFEIG